MLPNLLSISGSFLLFQFSNISSMLLSNCVRCCNDHSKNVCFISKINFNCNKKCVYKTKTLNTFLVSIYTFNIAIAILNSVAPAFTCQSFPHPGVRSLPLFKGFEALDAQKRLDFHSPPQRILVVCSKALLGRSLEKVT